MPIKTATLLRCGVLAALCWSVADMLLVGFVPHPELYPRLLALDAQLAGDGDFAALMLLAQYNAFYQLLQLHWLAAIALAAAGWLLVTVQIARRRSTLPRSFALLTPLPLAVLIGFGCSAFPTAPLAACCGGGRFAR